MTLEEALQAHLTTSLGGPKVYPLQLPAGVTLPAVTYQRVSTAPTAHRDGPTHGRARFQIDGWGSSFAAAVSLRGAIQTALHGWTQAAHPRVDATQWAGSHALLEPETGRWHVLLDYFISAEE